MHPGKKIIAFAVCFLALSTLGCAIFSRLPGGLAGSVNNSSPTEEPAPARMGARVGKPALAFDLPGLDGKSHALKDYQGQVVLVNFFATWCGPCQSETPVIQQLYETYREQGLVVVGVSVDELEQKEAVTNFVERFGVTYPVVLDPLWSTAHRYGVRGIPVSVFIDPEGIVRSILVGGRTAEVFEQEVLDLLSLTP